MLWLFILLFPFVAHAANIPQPSDVVFVHEAVSEDKQDSYNYIFTLANDDTIYTCQANRCSLLDFRNQPKVDVTFYQLPEGYQRVAGMVDQAVLQEYRSAAVAQYHFSDLETELSSAITARSYHVVTIHEDGTYDRDTASKERNLGPDLQTQTQSMTWIWWFVGGAIVMAAGAGWILWKRRN